MGVWTLIAGVLCAAALALSFVRWLSSARDVTKPATFAFGADRHMRCACPACKALTKAPGASVRAGFGPDGTPVSGRRRGRGSKLLGSFSERKRVAVIGAGAAGASAARQLAERGHSVVVFESAVDVGGRAFTLKQRGYHQFDSGAGFFTNFYPLLWHYIDALNMKGQVLELSRTNELVEQVSGRRYALSLGSVRSFFRMPFLTLVEKLRFLLFTLYLRCSRTGYDIVDPAVLAKHDTTSAALAAITALGRRVYATLVRPGIEVFWYFSCRDTSAALFYGLTALAPTTRFYTLASGMDAVIRRLLTHPNILVRCDAPVVKVTGGLQVTYGRGDAVGVDKFQAVVIATTADQAARLVRSDPGNLSGHVSADMLAFLESQRYSSNVHGVFTVDREEVAGDNVVTSYMPCGDGEWTTAAVSLVSAKTLPGVMPVGREGVQVYLMDEASKLLIKQFPRTAAASSPGSEPCGDASEGVHPRRPGQAHPNPTAGLAKQIWQRGRELAPSLPPFSGAACVSAFVRRHALPIPEVGRYRLSAALDAKQGGAVVFAGDFLATGTVEGALRSGMRAALLVHGRRPDDAGL